MRDKSSFPPGPYHVVGSGPRIRSVKAAGRTIAQILLTPRREAECEALGRLFAQSPNMHSFLTEFRDTVNASDTVPAGFSYLKLAAVEILSKVEGQ